MHLEESQELPFISTDTNNKEVSIFFTSGNKMEGVIILGAIHTDWGHESFDHKQNVYSQNFSGSSILIVSDKDGLTTNYIALRNVEYIVESRPAKDVWNDLVKKISI